MKITDLFTSKAVATYWLVKAKERAPYFGESKFPNKKKLGLDLSWIKGARKAPVMLSLAAFDTKAITLNRGEITKLSTEMPFFKNDMVIDEKQRQELNKLIGSESNKDAIKIVVSEIFNDQMHLIEDALLTAEVERMQILTTGALSIASNGQAYSYDFGVPSNHKVSPDVKWDTADADPIKDIIGWLDAIENETGVRPSEAVLNSVTLNMLVNCPKISKAIYVMGNGGVTPGRKEVIAYVQKETDLTLFLNSKTYKNYEGTQTKFIADGTVVFMPAGSLGNTWFGTTPEESDLMAGGTDAEVTIVETGVAITTTKQTDPVNVKTKASMICLPSFELADQVIIASVKTAG